MKEYRKSLGIAVGVILLWGALLFGTLDLCQAQRGVGVRPITFIVYLDSLGAQFSAQLDSMGDTVATKLAARDTLNMSRQIDALADSVATRLTGEDTLNLSGQIDALADSVATRLIGEDTLNISGRIDSTDLQVAAIQYWAFSDSNAVYAAPPGSVGDEIDDENYQVDSLGVKLFSLCPKPGYDGVHLGSVKLNVLYVKPVDSWAHLMSVGGRLDSTIWYMGVMLIAFRGGIADTVTELSTGVGSYIPFGAFSGYINPVPYRGSNPWAEVVVIDRRMNIASGDTSSHKNAVLIIRPTLDADSIQLWTRRTQTPCVGKQTVYYEANYAHFPSWDHVIEKSLHIQYANSMCKREDFVPLARQNYADSKVVYHAFHLGRQYSALVESTFTKPPFTAPSILSVNAVGGDYAKFQPRQFEDDFFVFDQTRPVIETELTAPLNVGEVGVSGVIRVKAPAWWNGVTWPSLAAYGASYKNWTPWFTTFLQKPNALGSDTSLWIHGNATIDSGATGTIWKVTCHGSAGDTTQTIYPVGSKVRFIGSNWLHLLGAEEWAKEGYYNDTTMIPLAYGPSSGVSLLPFYRPLTETSGSYVMSLRGAGIDCTVVGTAYNRRLAYMAYRAWYPEFGECPLRFPDGFEFYYQKGGYGAETDLRTADSLTWPIQSTTAFYTFGPPTSMPLGRCCYHQGFDCVDSVTYAECLATYGDGYADSVRWAGGERCFKPCELFNQQMDSVSVYFDSTANAQADSTWFNNGCAHRTIGPVSTGWYDPTYIFRFQYIAEGTEDTLTPNLHQSMYVFLLNGIPFGSSVDSAKFCIYKTKEGVVFSWADTLVVGNWDWMPVGDVAFTMPEFNSLTKGNWAKDTRAMEYYYDHDSLWISFDLNPDSVELYLGDTLQLGVTLSQARNLCLFNPGTGASYSVRLNAAADTSAALRSYMMIWWTP